MLVLLEMSVFTFLNEYVLVFPDFKWLGFPIPDPVPNLDHLQPNLFWPFKILTSKGSRSPPVFEVRNSEPLAT